LTLLFALWLAVAQAQEPAAEPPPEVPPAGAEDADVAIDEDEPRGIPGLPPGPAPAPDEAERLTHDLAKSLRCPVCQGLSVADSPSESAVAMKGRIRELVEMGYSGEQITDYFVSRYGEWILLEPPMSTNWLVWVAPALVGGLALAWVASIVAQWRKEPEPLPSDVGLLPKDEYEARLLREISDGDDDKKGKT
jgi:cytochrome c-type biogenesis protein CcmH